MLKETYTKKQKLEFFASINSGDLNINSEESKLFIAKIHEHNPISFAKAFLPEHFSDKTPEFHRELTELYECERFIAAAAPRGHAKSTLTSFAYIIHKALFLQKKSIVIVSSSEDMAKRFLRRIREELEYNEMINFLFGDLKTDKWSETELRLANRTVIHAKGRGAQLRGLIDGANRPDLIVLDDIEDEELVRSQLRRLDLEQWFNGTVLPTLDPKNGQVILIGTILHEASLLNRVLNKKFYPDFKTLKYAAIKPDGEPLWPERFTKVDLKRRKDAYIARNQLPQFFMEFMNDPMPQEAAAIKSEYIQFFDDLPNQHREEIFFETYIDLGGGGTKITADPTAIVTIAVDKHNNIFVHDYINFQYGTDTKKLIDDLFSTYQKYKPQRIIMEKTVATNMIKASLDAEQLKRNKFLPIELVNPPRGSSSDRRGNMSDAKYQRIAALSGPLKFGVIKIRPWMTELIEQLIAFPRATHDDLCDALAYGFMNVQRRFHADEDESDDLLYRGRKTDDFEPLYDEIGI